jgi:hypothetical protein
MEIFAHGEVVPIPICPYLSSVPTLLPPISSQSIRLDAALTLPRNNRLGLLNEPPAEYISKTPMHDWGPFTALQPVVIDTLPPFPTTRPPKA